jgi:hypothetical protein
MAARFRVKEPTRIGSREAHLTVRCLPRVLAFQPPPVARPPSPAVQFFEITSITPPKWFEPHLSCASDAL